MIGASANSSTGLIQHQQQFFEKQTGDSKMSFDQAVQQLELLRQQQASSLAYFDCFWLFAVLALIMVVCVLFMKRSVAEKGAPMEAE